MSQPGGKDMRSRFGETGLTGKDSVRNGGLEVRPAIT